MPELPDVEIFRRFVDENTFYKEITGFRIFDKRIIHCDLNMMTQVTIGCTFVKTHRHGKHLFVELKPSGKWITIHFGMTGGLTLADSEISSVKYEKFAFIFNDNSRLVYSDQRILGDISLTDSPDLYVKQHQLGPDALNISLSTFVRMIQHQKASIKIVLMDQNAIAGIGNVYADEILFQSKINPTAVTSSFSDEDIKTIYNRMHQILQIVIECNADRSSFPSYFLTPRRKKKQLCPLCSTPLTDLKLGGRTTYFCPVCQKE